MSQVDIRLTQPDVASDHVWGGRPSASASSSGTQASRAVQGGTARRSRGQRQRLSEGDTQFFANLLGQQLRWAAQAGTTGRPESTDIKLARSWPGFSEQVSGGGGRTLPATATGKAIILRPACYPVLAIRRILLNPHNQNAAFQMALSAVRVVRRNL